MTIVDQDTRNEIMTQTGNIVISASAGSGKTTIMIKKIGRVLEDTNNHKTVAAITFTIKATDEIKKKAQQEGISKEFVAMTNDSFIEQEIIRPFIIDTYGSNYSNDFTVDYDYKFNDFKNGQKSLVTQNKLGVFRNIKKNFKFQLALDILENNVAAREYLQSKYTMIFIDEYQDSDLDMHKLFMYFKNNLKINLFIVGDAKQAIYLWRGAQQNIFEILEQEDLKGYELTTNFRSHDEIVNYANLIHNNKHFNKGYNIDVQRVVHAKTQEFESVFPILVSIGEVDLEKEITIIINVNDAARSCAESLNKLGYNFKFIPRTPLDSNTPNSYFLRQLACYIIDENYSIYDFVEKVNADSRRQMVIRIEKTIEMLRGNIDCNMETIKNTIMNIGELLEIEFTHDEIQLLYQTLQYEEFHLAFINTEGKHKVMTVFASKGLEFSQVISFSSYYRVHVGMDHQNHYVSITRAKDKFIMIDDSNSYEEFIVKESKRLDMQKSCNLFKSLDNLLDLT